jgi:hypothetical protein
MAGPWEDREYVSRYGGLTTGLVLYDSGVPTDAAGVVTVDAVGAADGQPGSFTGRAATRVSTGHYEVNLTTADTGQPGLYDLIWHFTIGSVTGTAKTFIQIGESAPVYDSLDDDMKGIVERVWHRFADLFDSPYGGPHLQVYFQGHFGRQRIAHLLQNAVDRLNTIAQPHQSYSIAESGQFPVEKWGGLLGQALYVETIKHLIRSYVEQPVWEGVDISRADRRDYQQRWETVLQAEQEDLKAMLDVFKIANMGLGRPHVLVAGGVFGNYGPTRLTGSAASRPRYYARFYV